MGNVTHDARIIGTTSTEVQGIILALLLHQLPGNSEVRCAFGVLHVVA